MSAPPRIPRASPIHRRKPNLRRNADHRAFVASLPCLKCCGAPTDPAHVRKGADGGMGLKPTDSKYLVPLCRACHQEQHRIGEVKFWADLGIDPIDTAARLYSVSGDHDQGLRAILRARAAMGLKQDSARNLLGDKA